VCMPACVALQGCMHVILRQAGITVHCAACWSQCVVKDPPQRDECSRGLSTRPQAPNPPAGKGGISGGQQHHGRPVLQPQQLQHQHLCRPFCRGLLLAALHSLEAAADLQGHCCRLAAPHIIHHCKRQGQGRERHTVTTTRTQGGGQGEASEQALRNSPLKKRAKQQHTSSAGM
jgi:hypothetical protein